MKNLLLLALLSCLMITLNPFEADAQRRSSSDEYFEDGGRFVDRLWYGGGFILGLSGSQNSSLFAIGISPMVGYKIFDELSIGPRISYEYNAYRVSISPNEVAKANPSSYAAGLFSRFKFLDFGNANIFTHVEFELESEGNISDQNGFIRLDRDNQIIVDRVQRENFYVGAGYNSSGGGPWGFELLILYNVNEAENSIRSPINFRAGFTYNF
jgi:hypothetical protein